MFPAQGWGAVHTKLSQSALDTFEVRGIFVKMMVKVQKIDIRNIFRDSEHMWKSLEILTFRIDFLPGISMVCLWWTTATICNCDQLCSPESRLKLLISYCVLHDLVRWAVLENFKQIMIVIKFHRTVDGSEILLQLRLVVYPTIYDRFLTSHVVIIGWRHCWSVLDIGRNFEDQWMM